MTFTFRKAIRENVGLIIGVIGPSGGGKTYSALRLAKGLANGKPFAAIDTEANRMLHYADIFEFEYGELNPPFRPETYADAIKAADVAGYPVIIVDSVSHVWAGDSGVLDWHEEELQRMAGNDWKKRESCKMAAWIQPKMAHKQMVQRLLQVKAHLILCFRAEEKVKMMKGKQGKMEIVPVGFQPICEKSLPYELTMSFLLTPDKPGVPSPIKLQEQHKAAIDLTNPLDEAAGAKLLEWASSSPVKEPAKKVHHKPLTAKQGKQIIKIGAKRESPLSQEEVLKVIDWYTLESDNEHGGRTFEAGQALIFGFDTIFNRFLDSLEKGE
jgi:RecA/RadA recombinase